MDRLVIDIEHASPSAQDIEVERERLGRVLATSSRQLKRWKVLLLGIAAGFAIIGLTASVRAPQLEGFFWVPLFLSAVVGSVFYSLCTYWIGGYWTRALKQAVLFMAGVYTLVGWICVLMWLGREYGVLQYAVVVSVVVFLVLGYRFLRVSCAYDDTTAELERLRALSPVEFPSECLWLERWCKRHPLIATYHAGVAQAGRSPVMREYLESEKWVDSAEEKASEVELIEQAQGAWERMNYRTTS